jgi:hypothetical protein
MKHQAELLQLATFNDHERAHTQVFVQPSAQGLSDASGFTFDAVRLSA